MFGLRTESRVHGRSHACFAGNSPGMETDNGDVSRASASNWYI